MLDLEQLSRGTAEDLFFKSMLIEGDILLPLEHKTNQAAIKRVALIILSALNEAVKAVVIKQSEELSDRLYTAYDFLWGTLHYEQPCDCEDCVHVRTGLRKLAKFIEDAGGDIPDKKKIPPKE